MLLTSFVLWIIFDSTWVTDKLDFLFDNAYYSTVEIIITRNMNKNKQEHMAKRCRKNKMILKRIQKFKKYIIIHNYLEK